MKTNIQFWSYLTQFFLEWEIFQTEVVQKIKTRILCSITFFFNHAIFEIMWENNVQRARPHENNGNMGHAHNMLDYYSYKRLLIICNTYCFPLQRKLHLWRKSLYKHVVIITVHMKGTCVGYPNNTNNHLTCSKYSIYLANLWQWGKDKMQLLGACFSSKIIETMNGLFRSWEKLCLCQRVALKTFYLDKY
jgi:hypothetical protein